MKNIYYGFFTQFQSVIKITHTLLWFIFRSMLEDIKTEMNAQERIIKRSSLISEEQKAVIGKVKDDIYALFKELDEMKRNFEREKARLSLSEKYWKQVQEARKHFSVRKCFFDL